MNALSSPDTSDAAPATEDAVFDMLGRDPIPVAEILSACRAQAAAGGAQEAVSWAELLQEALAEKGDEVDAGVDVLAFRVEATPGGFDRTAFEPAVIQVLGELSDRRLLTEHLGIGEGVALAEALRRLRLLLGLKPDVLVYDKTWGLGVVQSVDLFYKRVEIDFDRKKEHFLSLTYAAETLEKLEEDHLLACRHRDADALQALTASQPGEVVKIALASFGPLTAEILQEKLVAEGVVADGAWKAFWDGARKALKSDPHVALPPKRTDPITLLDEAQAYDAKWFVRIAAERHMPTLLREIEGFLAEGGEVPPEADRNVLADRLAFVIKGAGAKEAALTVGALLAGRALGFSSEELDPEGRLPDFLDPATLLATVDAVPARSLRPFLEDVIRERGEAVWPALVAVMPQLEVPVLSEVIRLAGEKDRTEAVAAVYRDALRDRDMSLTMCLWLARNMDVLETWSLGRPAEFGELVLQCLEQLAEGESVRLRNALALRFQQRSWLEPVLAEMNDNRRRLFLLRVRDSLAFPTMDRRSALGQMVKLYPELEQALVSDAKQEAPKGSDRMVTSPRSYRERQEQLEKITNTDIPQNSKEIAVARSYGDLRENFEYKAAKDMQALLMRRKAELEQMLGQIRPFEFPAPPPGAAALGAGVRIRYDDGRTETYFLLGQWDRDEALGIISCESKMAQALDGHRAGERVAVPGEDGPREVLVEEVLPLPDEVRAWVQA